MHGRNGYPSTVLGAPWFACTVNAPDGSGPLCTDIYPAHGDSMYVPRTTENSPWLSADQCAAINAPHSREHWQVEARTFAVSAASETVREKAHAILLMEPVFKARWERPNVAFSTEWGGFVPC